MHTCTKGINKCKTWNRTYNTFRKWLKANAKEPSVNIFTTVESMTFLSFYSWFSPTWLLPWRRLLSAMLVPKQTRSIERSQWERKFKSVLCVVLCCGSRSNWDKLIGLYRIPSVVFATRRIWGRTDYRAERKIKNKSDQSRRHGIERRV